MPDALTLFFKDKPAIRLFPEATLRQVAVPVMVFNSRLSAAIERMIHLMRIQKMGIGIAAPQLGLGLRIAVVDVRARDPAAKLLILINPEIISHQGQKLSHEGCMSLPEYVGYLQRWETVKIQFQDPNGRLCIRECSGLEAVCVQHEVDHLDGKLFFDRVVAFKTDMLPRHWKRNKCHP